LHEKVILKIYQKFAKMLLNKKSAFICFCSDENGSNCTNNCIELTNDEIKDKIEKKVLYTLKLKKPNINISFNDTLEGTTTKTSNEIGQLSILKESGEPTYTFACAIDDMLEGITTVIRDNRYLDATAEQKYIQKLLGYDKEINYCHIPPIEHKDSNNTLKWLLMQGFLPDSIINYLITLGYKREDGGIFYLPEAIKWYDLSNLTNKSVTFNLEDLKDINREHLRSMDSKALSKLVKFADSDIGDLLKLYLNEHSTLNELEEIMELIFNKKNCDNEHKEIMQTISAIILKAPIIDSYEEFINYIGNKSNINKNELITPLRLLFTGQKSGPELKLIYKYLKSYLLEVARCR